MIMSLNEIDTLTKKYEELKHDVNAMRQGVNNMQSSLHRIEHCLMSDDAMGHDGLVKKHKDLSFSFLCLKETVELIISDNKSEKAVKAVKATMWGIIGGIFIMLVELALNKVF